MRLVNSRKSERGSALVYILIAIALLAALTVTFMEPSSQQTSSQGSLKSATEIQSQIDQIRSAVQECVLRYGNGDQDPAIDTSDVGANKIYPLKPNSTYLDTPASDRLARNIRCPGHNDGTQNNHQPVFAGNTGKFLPAPPALFEEWQWYNGTDGVFFWTRTTKSDAYLKDALTKLDEKFSECEADAITGAFTMDTDDETECAAGETCFRVWIIQQPSALYPAGSDEDTAGC